MDSDKPQITIYNHEIGTTIIREMTDVEHSAYLEMQANAPVLPTEPPTEPTDETPSTD
jgi:hypothetical protein